MSDDIPTLAGGLPKDYFPITIWMVRSDNLRPAWGITILAPDPNAPMGAVWVPPVGEWERVRVRTMITYGNGETITVN